MLMRNAGNHRSPYFSYNRAIRKDWMRAQEHLVDPLYKVADAAKQRVRHPYAQLAQLLHHHPPLVVGARICDN